MSGILSPTLGHKRDYCSPGLMKIPHPIEDPLWSILLQPTQALFSTYCYFAIDLIKSQDLDTLDPGPFTQYFLTLVTYPVFLIRFGSWLIDWAKLEIKYRLKIPLEFPKQKVKWGSLFYPVDFGYSRNS